MRSFLLHVEQGKLFNHNLALSGRLLQKLARAKHLGLLELALSLSGENGIYIKKKIKIKIIGETIDYCCRVL